MIINPLIGKDGRLGNQLFQYAAARATSLRLSTDLKMVNGFENFEFHGQKCLLKNFNIKYKIASEQDFFNLKYRFLDSTPNEETFARYNKISDDTCLFGHFESELYFIENKNIILDDLRLPDIEQRAKDILSKYNNPFVLHIRIGDNSANPKMISDMFKKFDEMIKFIPKNSDILFIGGGRRTSDSSLDNEEKLFIKNYFKDYNIHDYSSPDPLLDLELMKHSYGNVVGSESTFGWWGCYRNTSSKFIFYPKQNNIKPRENWILI